MGVASIGFSGQPPLRFRIDPTDVQWNFQVHTAVTPTVGGRVVQIIGATLSDVTIHGSYGEDRSKASGSGGGDSHPGRSWRLAEEFVRRIRAMQELQAEGAVASVQQRALTHTVPVFHYPPKGWRFACYIKGISDPVGGGSVSHRTGKFAYEYDLTLFIEEDASADLATSKIIGAQRSAAIEQYISRISNGIGWKLTQFNGPSSVSEIVRGTSQSDLARLAKELPSG